MNFHEFENSPIVPVILPVVTGKLSGQSPRFGEVPATNIVHTAPRIHIHCSLRRIDTRNTFYNKAVYAY